jgi:hypothetical protein
MTASGKKESRRAPPGGLLTGALLKWQAQSRTAALDLERS